MDCSRDRIHEPFDADIHEGPFGVISVCTSSTNVNEDVDLGDFLTLTGQVYCEEQPNIDPFICNYKNQIPLRLIRSYKLQDDIAPNTGYRYDGLYIVIGCWIGITLDGIKYNKFALMRLTDQESGSWNSKISTNFCTAQRCIPFSTKSVCPNTYALRKCSLNIGGKRKLNHKDDCESLPVETLKTVSLIDISRKSVPESSIVMRHVSKKPLNNTENAISTSVPDRKTLTCLGASTTKTHSTNISIRMGLYESSHNAQDTKKNVSTMLYKPTKPLDITNRILDIESVRIPLKEDSKSLVKVDTDKMQINPSLNENVSYNKHIVVDNANEIPYPLNKRKRNICSMVKSSLEHSQPVSSLLNTINDDTNNAIDCRKNIQNIQKCSNDKLRNHSSNEPIQKLNSLDRSIQKLNPFNKSVQKLNSTDESPHDLIIMQDEKLPKHHEAMEMSIEPFGAQNIKSLDSLTPDKILNLINKEKHHPLSKMLIGNVIGLTLEECAMLNASKTMTLDTENKTHASSKMNLKKRDNVKENVACLENRRYCRYSRSKRLSWKVTKQSDTGKLDKVLPNIDCQSCNDVNEKQNGNTRISSRNDMSKGSEYLSPFRMQASLQTITRHTRSSNDIKTRLRADKGILVKREFSNSSIKKSRYKKRDREVANLSIDANFGPMPRGPRNRRLRCRNSTYANKKYCNTVIYSPNKRYKSTFKRKSKLTKVNHQLTRDRQAKDRYRVSNTLHTNNKDVNSIKKQKNFKNSSSNNNNSQNCSYSDNDKNEKKKGRKTENEIITIDVNDHNISNTTFDRNLQKKLTQTTVSLSHCTAQTSHLHCFHKRAQIEKPNMTDATTQCRLISENPQIYVIGHLDDHKAVLKMEWPKFEELKSESCVMRNNRKSRMGQTSRFCRAFTEENICHKNGINSMQDGGSAFVPVHMLDSDLRIARLRSIGFKPIIKPLIRNDSDIIENTFVSTSKVTKRDVSEEYNKYTNNEDNNVVVYMDDELQYQDIEEEDNESALMRECRTSLVSNVSTRSTLKSIKSRDNSVLLPETLPSRENLESPWHGWKKIVTNNRAYWIGW